jgi:hypothetical protein
MSAPLNNEDKKAWCQHGSELEEKFVESQNFAGVKLSMNPQKQTDVYVHDILATFQADLKTIRTPFKTANRYGIPSEFAITLNEKDIQRYRKIYPNIILFFDIDYPNYKGVRIAPISRILRLLDLNKAKRHEYLNRVNDTSGNAKVSYVFDFRWFDEIKTS